MNKEEIDKEWEERAKKATFIDKLWVIIMSLPLIIILYVLHYKKKKKHK